MIGSCHGSEVDDSRLLIMTILDFHVMIYAFYVFLMK